MLTTNPRHYQDPYSLQYRGLTPGSTAGPGQCAAYNDNGDFYMWYQCGDDGSGAGTATAFQGPLVPWTAPPTEPPPTTPPTGNPPGNPPGNPRGNQPPTPSGPAKNACRLDAVLNAGIGLIPFGRSASLLLSGGELSLVQYNGGFTGSWANGPDIFDVTAGVVDFQHATAAAAFRGGGGEVGLRASKAAARRGVYSAAKSAAFLSAAKSAASLLWPLRLATAGLDLAVDLYRCG